MHAKEAVKTKLITPQVLLAPPNKFDIGSIKRAVHPSVAAVNISPSDPVLTPMSYNLFSPAFLRTSTIDLKTNLVSVKHQEWEPCNPIEGSNEVKEPHGPSKVPKRPPNLSEEWDTVTYDLVNRGLLYSNKSK